MNYEKIPDIDDVLWQGPWQWALYDVIDPDIASKWIHRGVHYIESWDVGRLLGQEKLASTLRKTSND